MFPLIALKRGRPAIQSASGAAKRNSLDEELCHRRIERFRLTLLEISAVSLLDRFSRDIDQVEHFLGATWLT